MHNIVNPTVQMGKLRYREAKNLPKDTQPTSGRAGIQTDAQVCTPRLGTWEGSASPRTASGGSLAGNEEPNKDTPQSLLLNVSHSTRRGGHGQRPSATQATTRAGPQADSEASAGLCSRTRACWMVAARGSLERVFCEGSLDVESEFRQKLRYLKAPYLETAHV